MSIEKMIALKATAFPGYDQQPPGSNLIGFATRVFEIYGPSHTTFSAEWPIPVSVPASLRGFRHSLALSQAKFAERIGENRLNIERWEGGRSRPFRGDLLSLIHLLRPHARNRVAVGQLLNLAAAAVCPTMTRPAKIYTGHEIAAPLAAGRRDHRDLAPLLISALIAAEILLPLEPEQEEELDSRYLPLVGANVTNAWIEPWDAEVRAVARQLTDEDRQLWLMMGRRLGMPPDGGR